MRLKQNKDLSHNFKDAIGGYRQQLNLRIPKISLNLINDIILLMVKYNIIYNYVMIKSSALYLPLCLTMEHRILVEA